MTDKIWKFFTSLRLTVILLVIGTLLVFLGTIAQVNEGLWNAQDRWFRKPLVMRQAGVVSEGVPDSTVERRKDR